LIERRQARYLTHTDFRAEYVDAHRPVILSGAVDDWPALRWTPERLKAACGEIEVEVQGERATDPDFEVNSISHKRTMPFGTFVGHVFGGEETNDLYMVANNGFLERAGRTLTADLGASPYLDAAVAHGRTFLWFGPAGTVTPLHYDVIDILYVQVLGEKRFSMIDPRHGGCLYQRGNTVFSAVDYEHPDMDLYPAYGTVTAEDIELTPGQTMFIPTGWWHHVRSLSCSASVSFTNIR
jgi:hypothetical protein